MQFPCPAAWRLAVTPGNCLNACELVAEQSAFFVVEFAAFSATAYQTGSGERAGHGPIAVGVEDLKKEKQIFDLKILNGSKDYFIEQLRKEREGMLSQLRQR